MPPSDCLREDERIYIADRVREKVPIREIARARPCASTISREIRRNRHPTNVQYRPHAAQARADARRPRPKLSKIGQNPELRAYIKDHLHKRWSPEQIVQSLRRSFPDRPEMHTSQDARPGQPGGASRGAPGNLRLTWRAAVRSTAAQGGKRAPNGEALTCR